MSWAQGSVGGVVFGGGVLAGVAALSLLLACGLAKAPRLARKVVRAQPPRQGTPASGTAA